MSNHLTEDEVMRRLAEYRPMLTDEWNSAARAAALATAVVDDHAGRVRYAAGDRRVRWLAAVGGVAAVAVAVVVLKLLSSGTSHAPSAGHPGSPQPTASALSRSASPASGGPVERLADAARHTPLLNPHTGQFWYQRVEQFSNAKKGARAQRIETTKNWVAPDGDDWRADDRRQQHSCTLYKYVGTPTINHPNAAYLRSLPTDVDQLYEFLRRHVTGSDSMPQAVFVAIGDALHNDEGLVQPALRAAFIEVLGRLRHVTVRSDVAYGNHGIATTFTFADDESLWFDEYTAQLVYASGAPSYRIVDALPPHVADRTDCPRGSN